MKILIIHNRYQQRGGEDTTFEQEVDLLNQTEEAKTLTFQNASGWKGALQFTISIWNIFSSLKIKKAIREFKPEVVHVHNWHYAIGPLVIRTVVKMKIPVVLTVQNFRLLCPSATLLDEDSLFLDSLTASFPWKAIRKKLYRNSLVQTFWLAFIIWFHKKIGTWKMVGRYILQTELARSVFVSSSLGADESQFTVKPNFIRDPNISAVEREGFFLYVGRLSGEKGVQIMVEAFKNRPFQLYIGGAGPLKGYIELASKTNPNIHYLGLLDKEAVMDWLRRCTALIFPSIWYEGMPLILVESFASGTPVIASNLGAMSSMIKDGLNGLHFTAGNVTELRQKTDFWMRQSKNEKYLFSANARAEFEAYYTPEKNRVMLLNIYRSVI